VEHPGRASQIFYLSRIMTSVAQIDATYGHLVPDSEEYLLGLLDTFDAEVGSRSKLRFGSVDDFTRPERIAERAGRRNRLARLSNDVPSALLAQLTSYRSGAVKRQRMHVDVVLLGVLHDVEDQRPISTRRAAATCPCCIRRGEGNDDRAGLGRGA
jgi:hypothetical protein